MAKKNSGKPPAVPFLCSDGFPLPERVLPILGASIGGPQVTRDNRDASKMVTENVGELIISHLFMFVNSMTDHFS